MRKGSISRARDISEPFSPEPMAQGPGPARRCGKDGRGAGVARTGAAHLASPRTLPRHHADPGQSGAFLARKAHCGGPGSTRCRKEHAEQDPEDAAESAEIAGLRAEKRGLRTEMRVA